MRIDCTQAITAEHLPDELCSATARKAIQTAVAAFHKVWRFFSPEIDDEILACIVRMQDETIIDHIVLQANQTILLGTQETGMLGCLYKNWVLKTLADIQRNFCRFLSLDTFKEKKTAKYEQIETMSE